MTRAAASPTALAAVLLCTIRPVAAQGTLPDFATCMDSAAAAYEAALRRAPEEFDIGSTRDVTFCGTLGIVRCDRGDDPIPCQHALAREQDSLAAAMRATLPPPRDSAQQPTQDAAQDWPAALYPVLHALAHGISAGPDCAGSTTLMAAWCDAREANRRLGAAMLAWQLARYLDAAPSATAAGWADPPPPRRPVSRQEADQ